MALKVMDQRRCIDDLSCLHCYWRKQVKRVGSQVPAQGFRKGDFYICE